MQIRGICMRTVQITQSTMWIRVGINVLNNIALRKLFNYKVYLGLGKTIYNYSC